MLVGIGEITESGEPERIEAISVGIRLQSLEYCDVCRIQPEQWILPSAPKRFWKSRGESQIGKSVPSCSSRCRGAPANTRGSRVTRGGYKSSLQPERPGWTKRLRGRQDQMRRSEREAKDRGDVINGRRGFEPAIIEWARSSGHRVWRYGNRTRLDGDFLLRSGQRPDVLFRPFDSKVRAIEGWLDDDGCSPLWTNRSRRPRMTRGLRRPDADR